MAIYHLHVKSVSRGTGSAQAKADYISREGKYQADRDEVAYSEHGHMPNWADDWKKYWVNSDIYERANGRLFVHVEFALPVELSRDQQQELASNFCRQLAQTSQGQKLPYSMAIHKGRGENNPHCHLMINERINDGISRGPSDWFRRANTKDPAKGGAQKAEELRSKFWLRDTRKLWSEMANQSLKKYGHNTSIDHRTLAAQGIDREPQYHLGPAAAAMERKNNSKEKNQGPVTARGAEYSLQLEIIDAKNILKSLEKEKETQTGKNKIQSRRVTAAPVVNPVGHQALQNFEFEAAKKREQAEASLAAYAREVDKLQKEYNKRTEEAKAIERSIYWAERHISEYREKVDLWTRELKNRDAAAKEAEALAEAAKAERQKLWSQLPEKIRAKIKAGKIKKPAAGFSLGLLMTGHDRQIREFDLICDKTLAAEETAAKSRIAATEAKMRRDEDMGRLKIQERQLAESASKLPAAQEAVHQLELELATAQNVLHQANARADQQWPERMQERQKKERESHQGQGLSR